MISLGIQVGVNLLLFAIGFAIAVGPFVILGWRAWAWRYQARLHWRRQVASRAWRREQGERAWASWEALSRSARKSEDS